MERGEPIWHTRSTEPMSMPSSSDDVATQSETWPDLSRLLGVVAALLGQAAVMGHDRVLAQAVGHLPRHALDEATCVDEDQRGLVGLHQLGDVV